MGRANKKGMLVVGAMSGTSADGVNVALVQIKEQREKLSAKLVAFQVYNYSPSIKKQIFALFPGDLQFFPANNIKSNHIKTSHIQTKSDIPSLSALNFTLGKVYAHSVLKCLRDAGIPPEKIDLIGSHGQTIYHCPKGSCPKKTCQKKICNVKGDKASTLQIGEGAVIAEKTGIPTVSDFRTADMAAEGTGAPLVPYPDYLLFSHPKKGRIILNIGGIANLTYLPPGGKPEDVIAFDTGPGNMLIDAVISYITGGKSFYDKWGERAKSGAVNKKAFDWLISNPFFKKAPPKATGREEFGLEFTQKFLSSFPDISENDAIATVTSLTIESIANSVKKFILSKGTIHEFYLAGGGAKNKTIVKGLQNEFPSVSFFLTDSLGIHHLAREAVAFAVLAYLTWTFRSGNLPQVTGAKHPVILGKVSFPPSKINK